MLISKGDIYWVDMTRIWSESDIHAQKGIRPCVIVSNNKNNDNNSRVIIVPLTTKKDNLPQHTMIWVDNVRNYVIPECITSIPKNLLGKKYGWISKKAFKYVIKAVEIQLGLWGGDKNERY